MTTIHDYTNYVAMAAALPQDASKPIYQDLNGEQLSGVHFTAVYTKNYPEPASVYESMRSTYGTRRRCDCYYVLASKEDENGKTLPRKVFRYILMYHKKWARKDIPVKSVSFDVVGLKRKSTKLDSAVLISNIKFEL